MTRERAPRTIRLLAAFCTAVILAGCVAPRPPATPQPHYKVGQPYKVNGRWYYPREDPDYAAVGMASWYGREFHGRRTANGEIFDRNRLSAAHTTLPLPSLVEVRNLENGRRAIIRVNDRGPFVKNRIIDLSQAAARKLGFERDGVARVKVRYLGRAKLAARAPRGSQMARALDLNPLLVGLAAEAAAGGEEPVDSISRIIVASVAEELTAGAKTFALAEAEAQASGEPPPPFKEDARGQTISAAPTAVKPGAGNAGSTSAAGEAGDRPLTAASPSPADAPAPTAAAADPRLSALSTDAGAGTLYAVQVAAFANLNNLEATKLALAELGVLRIARLERPQGALYRVRLGPFNDRKSAAEALAAVREAGYGDAKIITITP